jgi:hypothetical protein
MACIVFNNLLLIKDIPDNYPDPRYNFFGLMFERDARIYADSEARQRQCNARARYHKEDEEDIDDGGAYEDEPWRLFETTHEEARYEKAQRALRLGVRKREGLEMPCNKNHFVGLFLFIFFFFWNLMINV